jgi:hypothetical protein
MSGVHHLDHSTGICNSCGVQILTASSSKAPAAREAVESKAEERGAECGSAPLSRLVRYEFLLKR